MAKSSGGASMAVVTLLVIEGLGGLLVTLLNVVTSRALGQDFLPWESSVIPAGFGVLCLAAAFGVMRSASWGTILAALSQLLVLAAGVVALLDRVRFEAWVVVAIGVLGLILLSRTGRRA
jgi:uncharacterized membrane protein (DUF2068 family)